MASEYKKRGGDYNQDKNDQDDSQKNLSKWTEEEWQTKEGSGNAKQDDGTQKRYLPKKAWEDINEGKKEETDKQKLEEIKKGKQHVANTSKARGSRKKTNEEEAGKFENEKKGKRKTGKGSSATKKPARVQEETVEDQDDQESENDQETAEGKEANDTEQEAPKPGQKRGRGKAPTGSNKKQKANSSGDNMVGSKKDPAAPPAKQGSLDRLPRKGQTVKWKALPGWVEGKAVKAKKDDARIALRSSGPSGKIAVHKPGAVLFRLRACDLGCGEGMQG